MTNTTRHTQHPQTNVCPWWLIHSFDNPLRRLLQKPETVLQGLIQSGDRCLDIGCGYGYYTIPMARSAGASGSVTAADLQPQMLAGVKRRAEKAGLLSRIHLLLVDASGLPFKGEFDFALAFWMVHETPDQEALLRQIRLSLKPGGRFLLVEPKMHVREEDFAQTVHLAEASGFAEVRAPHISFSRASLMRTS